MGQFLRRWRNRLLLGLGIVGIAQTPDHWLINWHPDAIEAVLICRDIATLAGRVGGNASEWLVKNLDDVNTQLERYDNAQPTRFQLTPEQLQSLRRDRHDDAGIGQAL